MYDTARILIFSFAIANCASARHMCIRNTHHAQQVTFRPFKFSVRSVGNRFLFIVVIAINRFAIEDLEE